MGPPAFLFDIEKGEGKWCVYRSSVLLDESIIQGRKGKVNGLEPTFTICLQDWELYGFLFMKRSKYIVVLHIDGGGISWYYLAC